ncbi:TetR/AcrR family transcriptional regulator [Litoribacillus peritrichatus]|uniref:TetR/AcrR family transcriptional regulator n=1 Tax=Litoribacillus peritrichatus TaxID=718191 RepID=A0ABP7M9I2_9GAMM
MTTNEATPERIIDQAILLAQKSSWESFSLSELAIEANCSLADIKSIYRSKDDMVEAFFNRADNAMLSLSSDSKYQALSSDDRLITCIMTWFEYLAPYRPIIKEMMAYKLEPGHFHLQAHGITRVSRTVQWFLEVSNRNYSGLKRVADEVATTSAYLTSFAHFLFDDSDNFKDTRSLLNSLIKRIDQGHHLFFPSGNKKH